MIIIILDCKQPAFSVADFNPQGGLCPTEEKPLTENAVNKRFYSYRARERTKEGVADGVLSRR